MAINPYKGINAHLQSYLQSESGGWASFHARHITHLADNLDSQLPANYYTLVEKSLQIRPYLDDEPIAKPIETIPDVTVIQTEKKRIWTL